MWIVALWANIVFAIINLYFAVFGIEAYRLMNAMAAGLSVGSVMFLVAIRR